MRKKIANNVKEEWKNRDGARYFICRHSHLMFQQNCSKFSRIFHLFEFLRLNSSPQKSKSPLNELSLQCKRGNKHSEKKKKIVELKKRDGESWNATKKKTSREKQKMTKDKNKEREKILTLLALCLRQQFYRCASWSHLCWHRRLFLLQGVGEILKDSYGTKFKLQTLNRLIPFRFHFENQKGKFFFIRIP